MKKFYFIYLLLASLFVLPLKAQTGNALNLNGTSTYMRIPHHSDFNFTNTQDFSISFWISSDLVASRNARMVAKRGPGSATDKSGYELWGLNSAANFYALNSPNSAGTNLYSVWGTVAGVANTWTHIAYVVTGTGTDRNIIMYQNGVVTGSAKGSSKDVSSFAVTNAFDVIVGWGEYGGGMVNGKIDNLRFWNKALSATDVAADETNTVDASTPGLVAAYDFETVTGNTVSDIKGAHPGTISNKNKDLLGAKISGLNSSIGTQVGQYVSTQALQDAITAAQTVYNDPNSTDANYSSAITALNTAISAATINMPVASTLGSNETLYAIYTSTRNNATLMDVAAGSNLKSRSYTIAPTTFDNTQVWTFVSLSDGTYAIVNPFSNNYITNTNTSTNTGKISVTAIPYTSAGWKMDKASTFPLTILYSPGQYNGEINTSSTAGDQEVFNWGYNQGTKNTEGFSISDAGCTMKVVKVSERTAAAAAPTVDVPAGAVATGTPITVSCANTSDVIYYTLDDSDPKTSQTRVTINGGSGTFNAPQGNFTLKAFVGATQTHFASQATTVAYSIITSLDQASTAKYNVKVNNGFVTVDGAENFSIYSVAGQKLDAKKALNNGVYLIKVNNLTQKLIIR